MAGLLEAQPQRIIPSAHQRSGTHNKLGCVMAHDIESKDLLAEFPTKPETGRIVEKARASSALLSIGGTEACPGPGIARGRKRAAQKGAAERACQVEKQR